MNMCGFDEIVPQDRIDEYLHELNRINGYIAGLLIEKNKMERKILENLNLVKYVDCPDTNKQEVSWIARNGKQTIYKNKFKVEIKTLEDYKIILPEYHAIRSHLREEFDPVKTSIKYQINNLTLQNTKNYGSLHDNQMLDKFLEMRYSKPSITLTPNIKVAAL